MGALGARVGENWGGIGSGDGRRFRRHCSRRAGMTFASQSRGHPTELESGIRTAGDPTGGGEGSTGLAVCPFAFNKCQQRQPSDEGKRKRGRLGDYYVLHIINSNGVVPRIKRDAIYWLVWVCEA